jgi:eukaryotic-like serine/threonine-protein kinase
MKLCLQCNTHFQGDFEKCPDDGAKLVVLPDDPVIGKVLGDKYRILCAIGKGSMGVVYKAIQESTGREVAVKLLHHFLGGNSDSVKRFHREAKAVSRLNHPNIIRLYDFGVMDEGQPYIVTELLSGPTLADVLRKKGFISIKQAMPIFEQVCSAVGEAHRSRVIHRDLKPENIVLEDVDINGDLDAPDLIKKNAIRVLDFGVAKMWSDHGDSSAALTLEGKVCGSPAYMSPEQCRGVDVDYRTDVYSMGVVFFETLTGKRPFSADDLMALMLMHVNNQVPSLGAIQPEVLYSQELNGVIIKAMAKNPNERQQSSEELWEDLKAACWGRQKTVEVTPPEKWVPFEGKGGLVFKTGDDGSPSIETSDTYATLAPNNLLNWVEDREPAKKKRKPVGQKIFMVARSLALGAVIVFAGYQFISHYMAGEEAKEAYAMIKSGRYEDGAGVLQRLQNENRLPPQFNDTLSDAYVVLANRYARSGNYSKAVDALKHVPAKAKSYSQAQHLLKRWQARVH